MKRAVSFFRIENTVKLFEILVVFFYMAKLGVSVVLLLMTVSTSMNDGVCGAGLSSCGRPPQVRDAQKLYKLEDVGGTQVLHVEGNHCRDRFLSPQTNNSKLILLSIL